MICSKMLWKWCLPMKIMTLLVGLLVLTGAMLLRTWQKSIRKPFSPLHASTVEPLSSSVALVKKGKTKVLNQLRHEMEELGESHPIRQFLANRQYPFGIIKPPNLHQCLYTRGGTLTVMVEYNKKAKTGFILGMPPPEIMGGVLRDSGAKAIVAAMDARNGNVTLEEFYRFAKEQAKARLFLPPPIPLVWSDMVVDEMQLQLAATYGAAGITLHTDLLDDLPKYVHSSICLGLEPIVMVRSTEEGRKAIEAGARLLCLYNLAEKELVKVMGEIKALPIASNDIVYIARILPQQDFSTYYEIDLAWLLRDHGFNCVWPSPESIYAVGMPDIYPVITAFRSKASREFLSPRQFLMDRRNEGATEFLGDILY